MNKRDKRIDKIKGMLIILVVFGHFLYEYTNYNIYYNIIVSFIYSFHMPIFMIISGYLSKNIPKRNLFNLLILFVLSNISFIVCDYLLLNKLDILSIKYSSWYLLLLFLYRLTINNKTKNILNKYKYLILPISFALSLLSGLFNINLFISRIFYFYIFFLIGYYSNLKDKDNVKRLNSILITITIFLLLTLVIFNHNFTALMGGNYSNNIEFIYRGLIIILDIFLFRLSYNLFTNKESILSTIGKYSLYIYLIHRIPIIIFAYFIDFNPYLIFIFAILTILLIFLSTREIVIKAINKLLDISMNIFIKYKKYLAILLISIVLISSLLFILLSKTNYLSLEEEDKIHDSISIGFIGDLILLENQVKTSKTEEGYNFDYMFKYTSKYFKDTDYMIGVLEGPVDDTKEYSYGNFDDEKELRLNYPIEFLQAIKKSGIDLVTTSNNHLLDRGIDASKKTIENLEKEQLDYVGTGNNKRRIVRIDNLKVGVLAYTYGINYHDNDEYPDLTNYLENITSKDFNKSKQQVEKDFKYLKDNNCDLIIVLPHYGTQFNYGTDKNQDEWNKIFSNLGADIVFGDHPHVVEPIEYIKDTIVINSPGNYVNSYTGHDSDLSIMSKVYVDRKTKKVITTSIIPLIEVYQDKYYPIPINDIVKENISIPQKKKEKLNYANKLITKTTINKEIDIKNTEDEYFYFKDGYKKQNIFKPYLTESDKNTTTYKLLESANKICFIGDSITKGYNSEPWYSYLKAEFSDKEFINISENSFTTVDILDKFSSNIKNSNCDLSIINIGTNDIRYNKLTKEEYINNIKRIVSLTKGKVLLLSPWETTAKDKNKRKDKKEKNNLYKEYQKVLKEYSNNSNIYYKDPNKYIKTVLKYNGESIFTNDGVHPKFGYGIKLYSISLFR